MVTLKTINVPSGTKVGYAMSNPNDFGKTFTGEFIVSDNGITSITFSPIEDYKTEGTEILILELIGSSCLLYTSDAADEV